MTSLNLNNADLNGRLQPGQRQQDEQHPAGELKRLMAHESDAQIVQLHEYTSKAKGPEIEEYRDSDLEVLESHAPRILYSARHILCAIADMQASYPAEQQVDTSLDGSPIEVYRLRIDEYGYHESISVWATPLDPKYIYVADIKWGVDRGFLIKGTESDYWRIETELLRQVKCGYEIKRTGEELHYLIDGQLVGIAGYIGESECDHVGYVAVARLGQPARRSTDSDGSWEVHPAPVEFSRWFICESVHKAVDKRLSLRKDVARPLPSECESNFITELLALEEDAT